MLILSQWNITRVTGQDRAFGAIWAGVMLATVCGFIIGCAPVASGRGDQFQHDPVGMANPASRHCINEGGRLTFQPDQNGHQIGLCHLPDGSQMEEWALFRGHIRQR